MKTLLTPSRARPVTSADVVFESGLRVILVEVYAVIAVMVTPPVWLVVSAMLRPAFGQDEAEVAALLGPFVVLLAVLVEIMTNRPSPATAARCQKPA